MSAVSAVSAVNADGNFESIAAALGDAAADLDGLGQTHRAILAEFEGHGWAGLDVLEVAGAHQAVVVDGLSVAAERVGVGGQIVADALTSNHMITRASKASLGHG